MLSTFKSEKTQGIQGPTMIRKAVIFACLLLWANLLLYPAAASAPEKDWKTVPHKDLGLEPFKPVKDAKTGFVTGGKNETALLGKLTHINGRSIADLEKDMRPGELSTKGFLGPKESLLEILAADNEYVLGELKRTHQELAQHLFILGKIAEKEKGEIIYHGRAFKLTLTAFRGFANSPFEDGTKTNQEVEVRNVATGKTLRCSMLVPVMMERYGFYEGKGTPYRVEPSKIIEVLDFLK